LKDVPPYQPPPGGGAVPAPEGGYAVKWPLWRVIVFSIVSFGLFGFYWFYVTRKQITRQIGGSDSVGLQTLGLIVPILHFVIIYWLWRDISALRERVRLTPMPVMLYIGLLAGSMFVGLTGIAAIVLYILVLQALNEYWDASTDGQAVEKPATSSELMVTFALLGLAVATVVIIFAVRA
jgi:hypothetical protein